LKEFSISFENNDNVLVNVIKSQEIKQVRERERASSENLNQINNKENR
jgi:hypothetical protein